VLRRCALSALLATEVRAHHGDYLDAATWFKTEFSFEVIDARREAGMLPLARQIRDERPRAGWVEHERDDSSGFMERPV
jgi:hypothetical protein